MASDFCSSALEALVACAEAIEEENLQLADSLLDKIYKLVDCESDEYKITVLKYFAEALVRRAYGLQPLAATNFTLHLPPYLPFYHMRNVKMAIKNSVMGKKRLHLIDFYIPHQYKSFYIFEYLEPEQQNLSARVSVVLPPFLKTIVNVERETQYLKKEAKNIEGVELEVDELEVIYANSLSEVDNETTAGFRRTEDETVIVFYHHKLERLSGKEGAVEGELSKLRQINPDLVIILEQDADLHASNFIQRLNDSFQHYYHAFRMYSSEYYRRQIDNIVGCEGRDRIVRFQKMTDWDSCFEDAGFIQVCKTDFNEISGIFVSVWKLGGLEHNLNSKSGLISIPPTDNKVRPLQIFPQGHLLNQLAALTEIYDMVEGVSGKYELPLALTWTCDYSDKIMSGPYDYNVFSMEKDYCYAHGVPYHRKRDIFSTEELLSRNHLVKRKYEELLQPNKTFLFEPLFKDDVPITALLMSPHATVAICLQSHYNKFYVLVEFFLPLSEREPEELALDIFNDLKKMKKKFVKLRAMGTGSEFQEEEEAISTIPRERTNRVEGRDGHDMLETRGINEQGCEKLTCFVSNATDVVKDVSNSRITSTKRRKLTSDDWNEFNREEDEGGNKRAICKHCHRPFDGLMVTEQQMTCPVGRAESGCGDNYSFDQERSRLNLGRMIIKLQLPLNIVEEESFVTFLKDLQPKFEVASQEVLTSYIIRIYEEEKLKLLKYFDKLSCRFNLTINLWERDLGETVYGCYAVQFVDDNWEFKKKILALKMFRGDFEAGIFHESFKKEIEDWKFEKKVCSLTLYSSSSCSEMAEKITKSWHSFKTMYPSSTFYINGKECINMLGNVGTSNTCLLDVSDRYKELSQAERKCYPLMDAKSDDNNWRTCSLVLAIAAILDPRFKFDLVEFTYNKIYGDRVGSSHSTVIRDAFTNIFKEYAKLKLSEHDDQTSHFSDTYLPKDNTIESFQGWSSSKRNVLKKEKNIEAELDTYLQEPILLTKDLDLLSWWSEQASSSPTLGMMARDMLAIPISSTISGSRLSENAMMDNPIFNGLDPDVIEAMICSRDWLESRSSESLIGPSLAKPQPLVSISSAGNGDDDVLEIKRPGNQIHNSPMVPLKSNENRAILKRKLDQPVSTLRTDLVYPFTKEESECLDKWRSYTMSEGYAGLTKVQIKSLEPLLMLPPPDVYLREPQRYYIDDEVVNKFFDLLKERYERFAHKYLKHHSFDSSIATLLINQSRSESEVVKWVKKEDLKGTKKLFLPMCLREHWLLYYADIDGKKLALLDSNEGSRMSNDWEKLLIKNWVFEFLLPSLGHDPKDWSFDVPKDIPSQNNSVDCALFVMKYADCLTHGNHFPFSQDDMPYFRYRTFLDLYHGSIGSGKSNESSSLTHLPIQ